MDVSGGGHGQVDTGNAENGAVGVWGVCKGVL